MNITIDQHEEFLTIPLGINTETKETFNFSFQNTTNKDGSCNGILVGASGSGKTELLKTIVHSTALKYDFNKVNFFFMSFTGANGLTSLKHLPHTIEYAIELEEDYQITRCIQALEKEILWRSTIIYSKNVNTVNIHSVADYRRWHCTEIEKTTGIQRKNFLEKYPYLPELFIIIEDFSRALHIQPDFLKKISHISRLGKPLGINLLLIDQILNTPENLTMFDLQYFIALKTNSVQESHALIGNPDATFISYTDPGVGYIRYYNKPLNNRTEEKIEKIQFNYCGQDNPRNN